MTVIPVLRSFRHRKDGWNYNTPRYNMDEFLAKSNPPEGIRQHTDKLIHFLEELRHIYPECLNEKEEKIVRLAAEYHDYGKTIYEFQRDLSEKTDRVFVRERSLDDFYKRHEHFPHGYVSPAFLPIKELRSVLGDDEVVALVNAIFYHHTRTMYNNTDIQKVINSDLKTRLNERYKLSSLYLNLIQNPNTPSKIGEWLLYAIVKGTLNRLDYAASANEAVLEESRSQDGHTFADIVEMKLTQRFILRPVQEYMKENRGKNLIVIASTGLGKTEAACLWAGGSKLFYTLPLKVSINAIYKRLHNNGDNDYGFRNCALLHSDALSILMNSDSEDDEPLIKYNRTRLFSYPITVCTIDQLFTFVYRYRGCEIIPSVLKYSNVVIDEIQAYSPDIAAKIIIGLKMINDLGGRFAIITATMPPYLEDAIKRYDIPYEKPEPFYNDLSRHFLAYSQSDFDCNMIIEASHESKVLVICNTVKKACQMYDMLKDESNVRLLHSRFKHKHRRFLEQDIMDFSEGNKTGIWVTTQIVEASLDIDFDYLFTEMCTADSLLQRLGRCYRKREYTLGQPNVFVCDTGNGVGTVYDREIYNRSVQKLVQYCERIFSEREKNDYVCSVYDIQELKGSKFYGDFNKALLQMESLPSALFSAEEAKKKFREIVSVSVIDDDNYIDMIHSGELDALTAELCSKDKIIKARARQRFLDHTIGIDPRYSKVKPDMGSPIQNGCKPGVFPLAYRIKSKYEFDEVKGIGRGLILEPVEGGNFF